MGFWSRLTGKPDKGDFAIIMITSLRRVGESRPIQYEADGFKLRLGDGTQFFLDNAYNDYRAAPRRVRRSVLSRYAQFAVSGSPEMPESYEACRSRILPTIRSLSYHGLNKLRIQSQGSEGAEIPLRPIADHLAISLAYDSPHSIRQISQDDLSKWDVSFSEALDQATETLRAMSTERFERLAKGVYKSPWHDSYDASRLCLPDLIRTLDVDGDYVAAVPDRDTLLITGSQNLAALDYVATMCDAAFQAGRAITPTPVTLRNQSWLTFSPGTDHPLYNRFRALLLQERASDYAEQKTWLEAWHQRTGEDTSVAKYTVLQNNKTGALSSYCVWAEGAVALLPEADEVAFVKADGSLAVRCEWKLVIAELGDLMTPVSMDPKRFRVEQFPTPEQLARLLNARQE